MVWLQLPLNHAALVLVHDFFEDEGREERSLDNDLHKFWELVLGLIRSGACLDVFEELGTIDTNFGFGRLIVHLHFL